MKQLRKTRNIKDMREREEYMRSCLQSTAERRLDWLEEAHNFVKSVRFRRSAKKQSR